MIIRLVTLAYLEASQGEHPEDSTPEALSLGFSYNPDFGPADNDEREVLDHEIFVHIESVKHITCPHPGD